MTRHTLLCCSAICSAFLVPGIAYAQTAAPPPAPSLAPSAAGTAAASGAHGPPQLEQIVVTAQRRRERLVNVPVSVSVLSGTALAQRAISSTRDLQLAVPGLTVRAAFNADQLNYSIRGQTIDPFTYSQPGVLPYVNEYQVPAGYSSDSFYDLQSIQVLKGPQGTLFGRNAVGGAVLTTTVQPSDKLTGYIRGRAGDYGDKQLEGAINLPLVADKVDLRIAGRTAESDGYSTNLSTGSRLGNEHSQSFRASLLIKPTEDLTNTLIVDYTSSGGVPDAARLYSNYPVGATNSGIPLNTTASLLFSPAGDAVFGPGYWKAYLAGNGLTNTNAAGGLSAYYQSVRNLDPNADVRLGPDPHVSGKVFNLVNTTTYQLGSDTRVKAIFGYTRSITSNSENAAGAPYILELSGSALGITQLTGELQISGKTFDDKLTYVAGGYYLHSNTLSDQSAVFFDFRPVFPPAADFNLRAQATDEAEAAYAQGTYNLNVLLSGLEVTAGVRYTNEDTSAVQVPGGLYYTLFGAAPQTRNIGRYNYQVGLQYHLNRDAMVYGKVSTSFRSGGFNLGSAPQPGAAAQGGNGFLPEKTIGYEIGAKYEGLVLGIPARANASAFYQTVDNVQRAVYFIPPGSKAVAGFTANIPQARIKGIEVDGSITPLDWLQLGISGSFISAEFTQPNSTFFGQPITYGPYADTPNFSGSVYGVGNFPLQGIGDLSIRADLYHQNFTYFGSLNNTINPGTRLPGYTVANFRVALEDIRGTGVTAAFYVQNAFNEKYWVGGIPIGQVESVNTAVPGTPQTFFGELTYKF